MFCFKLCPCEEKKTQKPSVKAKGPNGLYLFLPWREAKGLENYCLLYGGLW